MKGREGQARWDKAEGERGLESQAREAEVEAGRRDRHSQEAPSWAPSCLPPPSPPH